MFALFFFSVATFAATHATNTVRELFPTPVGWRPKECVHTPEEENHVIIPSQGGVWVEYPDSGRRVFHEELDFCVDNAKQLKKQWDEKQERRKQAMEEQDVENQNASEILRDWLTYGGYYTPDLMGTFTSTYTLPNENPENDGQILYYFTGMQDNSDGNLTILQPVIAYCPAGCGWSYTPGWSGASWNCCPNGQTWYGAGVPMTAGVKVPNSIESKPSKGIDTVTLSYGGRSSVLNLAFDYRQYNWVCVTLEAYDYTSCDSFNSEPFVIADMALSTHTGANVAPQWSSSNALKNCGGSITYSNNNLQADIKGRS